MLDKRVSRAIWLLFGLVVFALIFWRAIDIFLLAFAAVLLAILLYALGSFAQMVTRLPYLLALSLALLFLIGIFTFVFWLYAPLITDQTNLLIQQLPQAGKNLEKVLAPYLGFLNSPTFTKELSFSNEKLVQSIVTVFSSTLGSVIGFIFFIILGFYLALNPQQYFRWFIAQVPATRQQRAQEIIERIGLSLKWWLLGKCLSMVVIGLLTFIGLWALRVNLALILGLLAALLAFIPYVGSILASIPAILIAFAQSPWKALYVTILYLVIHFIDGYFITPQIEQRTVSIPPGFTILVQMILVMIVGALGLALATPIVVVGVALLHSFQEKKTPLA